MLILAEWTTVVDALVLIFVELVWILAEFTLILAEWTTIVDALVLAATEIA